MTIVLPRDIVITAPDGFRLAGTHTPAPGSKTAIVIAGATGVKRAFYQAFAEHLAADGFHVVTFDYRGVGGSAPKPDPDGAHSPLKGFDAAMRQWGEVDLDAVLAWTRRTLKLDRLLVVGHSVGGQLLGFAENAKHVDAALFVASQSGYWGHWPVWQRPAMAALWFGFIPALSPLLGFFPSRTFRLGDDLPAGVAQQWARWGRHPDYLMSEGGDIPARFARLRIPILAHSIDGDFYAPEAAVEALLGFYAGAERRHRHLKGPGHFTYFRPKWSALWDDVVDWLREPHGVGSAAAGEPNEPPVAGR